MRCRCDASGHSHRSTSESAHQLCSTPPARQPPPATAQPLQPPPPSPVPARPLATPRASTIIIRVGDPSAMVRAQGKQTVSSVRSAMYAIYGPATAMPPRLLLRIGVAATPARVSTPCPVLTCPSSYLLAARREEGVQKEVVRRCCEQREEEAGHGVMAVQDGWLQEGLRAGGRPQEASADDEDPFHTGLVRFLSVPHPRARVLSSVRGRVANVHNAMLLSLGCVSVSSLLR